MITCAEKSAILEKTSSQIINEFGLVPWVATEIEFYVTGLEEVEKISNEIMLSLTEGLKESGINYIKIEKERGKGQYEVALRHEANPLKIADATCRLKEVLAKAAQEVCLNADFGAKPLEGQFGSGLHIHLSLHDKEGRNLFIKQGENTYSEPLLYAAGGMLATMKEFMVFFAPHENSYARFAPKMNAPVTVSWGNNNRTTALRLPTSQDTTRHIEHRVSGSDADPYLAIAAVLAGAHYGLKHKIRPPEQIYGDASLSMYQLELLPKSLREAEGLYKAGEVANGYFGDISYKP